jgi:transposase, IS5 family
MNQRSLIQPYARGAHQALGGRPPFPIETMLRIHCLQLWWNLSDPAMEEELHERPLYRRFAGLDGAARMPHETTILRFRHLLEKHQLAPTSIQTPRAGSTPRVSRPVMAKPCKRAAKPTPGGRSRLAGWLR